MLTFNADISTHTVDVALINDSVVEPSDEAFSGVLVGDGSERVAIDPSIAAAIIMDDDGT